MNTQEAGEKVRRCRCGHPRDEHGQEREFTLGDSRREMCALCPGYEFEDGVSAYPRGQAWHRFKLAEESVDAH